jgi:hypothetical protein
MLESNMPESNLDLAGEDAGDQLDSGEDAKAQPRPLWCTLSLTGSREKKILCCPVVSLTLTLHDRHTPATEKKFSAGQWSLSLSRTDTIDTPVERKKNWSIPLPPERER